LSGPLDWYGVHFTTSSNVRRGSDRRWIAANVVSPLGTIAMRRLRWRAVARVGGAEEARPAHMRSATIPNRP
jgi:hypothetical protein